MASQSVSRVVFWEPSVSPHKMDLVRCLAARAPNVDVVYVADQDIPADRLAMGWSIEEYGAIEPVIAPTIERIHALIAERPDRSLHVFSGIRWVPSIVAAIRVTRRIGARFAIMSEPRSADGLAGKLRYVQSWLTERWFRRNSQFILAIGRNGPPWFRSVGYPQEKVFPFAYFVSPREQFELPSPASDQPMQVGFVGRLIEEKGVYDLIEALRHIRNVVLTVVGDGPEGAAMRERCEEAGLSAMFLGVKPIGAVGSILSGIDILVLPSTTKDGWGAVVSEALLAGCAVIATSEVGASVLLEGGKAGSVVRKQSPMAIATAINSLRDNGALDPIARRARRTWAESCLTGAAGAAHMLQVIEWVDGGPRPEPFYLNFTTRTR